MYNPLTLRTRSVVARMAFDFMVDQNQFLADKLFDPKMVDGDTKKVPQFDASKLKVTKTLSKTDAKAPLIDEQIFYRDINLDEHKLGKKINPYELANSDNPSLIDESRAGKIITLNLLMARELTAASIATNVSNYPTDLTSAIAGGSRWTDAGGDPEKDSVVAHNALVNRVGRKANAVALSGTTLRKLKTSANFRSRVQYTQAGPVSDDAIKAFFGVDYLFASDAVYDSANEGATSVISGFWGLNAIFFVYQPGLDDSSTSYGALWLNNEAFWSKTFDLQDRNGRNGPMRQIEIGTSYALTPGYVVSSASPNFAAGYLFRTVVD